MTQHPSTQLTKEQILQRVQGLQNTRQYAAPEERPRLTAEIERLLRLYDVARKGQPTK